MTAVIIDQAVGAIAAIAEKSRDASRPILSGLRLSGSRAFAADGYAAIAVDLMPKSGRADLTLIAKDARALLKDAKRKKLTEITVHAPTEAIPEAVACVDDECDVIGTLGNTYPNFQHIFDNGNSNYATVTLDVHRFAELVDAVSRCDPYGGMVTLTVGAATEPIFMSSVIRELFDGSGDRRIDAVLMPIVTSS